MERAKGRRDLEALPVPWDLLQVKGGLVRPSVGVM